MLVVEDIRKISDGSDVISFKLNVDNLTVFGAGLLVHISPQNNVTWAAASLPRGLNVATEPELTAEEAAQRAISPESHFSGGQAVFIESELLVFNDGLLNGEPTGSALAWRILLAGGDPSLEVVSFIDASTGNLLHSHDDNDPLEWSVITHENRRVWVRTRQELEAPRVFLFTSANSDHLKWSVYTLDGGGGAHITRAQIEAPN